MRQIIQKVRCANAGMMAMLLVLMFLAAGLSCVSEVHASESGQTTEAAVSTDGSGSANGVVVSTSTDKESYKSGEEAVITVSVKNTNAYDMTEVNVEYNLPSNFALAEGEKNKQTINSLAAGETKDFPVRVIVSEDPNAPLVDSGGLPVSTILLIVAAILVIAAAGIFVIRKKGKTKQTLSVILVAAMTGGLVAAAGPQQVSAITADGLAEESDFVRVMVHDPSIVKDQESGMYYIFGSHLGFVKSSDLFAWESFECNVKTEWQTLFAEPWEWADQGNHGTSSVVNLNGQMWAPDVIYNDTMKKWCMYMSIDGNDWCSSICLLTADKIEGPYEYKGIVVYSGMNNPKSPVDLAKTDVYQVLDESDDLARYRDTNDACINAIDPCVRYDDDGNLYMTYGSWSAGVYILKLDPKTGLRDYSNKYETVKNQSDAYYGIKVAGGYYNSGEGSYILHAGDYYYLFLSYAALEAQGGYQIRIYRSENIEGPYLDQNGVSAISDRGFDYKATNYGVKIFGSYDIPGLPIVQVAQGHNSAFVDEDGKIYLVYHTRFSSQNNDQRFNVRVHQMFINADGWLVAAPYEYTGESLPENGYTAADVAGEYKFIYHEPTMFYQYISQMRIGVVGAESKTTNEQSVTKEIVVAGRKAQISAKISYTHEGGARVQLTEDGQVTGDRDGTWKFTDGANVEMELDGVTYKGVFLKQEDESRERNMRMTFTALGDNVTIWGVQTNEQLGITEEDGE